MAKSSHQASRKIYVKQYDKANQIAITKPTKISRSSQIQAQPNPILQKLMIGYYLVKENMETAYIQQTIAANEKNALNMLIKYAKAQEQYHQHYGYYAKANNLVIANNDQYTILDPDLLVVNSANSPEQADNGYFYLHTGKAYPEAEQSNEYCLNAIPAEYGQSGINTFCINQQGNMLQENNGAKPIYQPKALDQTNQAASPNNPKKSD